MICGLAKQEWELLLGRTLAGLGGGAIYAISTFVGSDLVPVRREGSLPESTISAMEQGLALALYTAAGSMAH
jgi:MFS family permease